MTTLEQINTLAEQAAEAAVDAFGRQNPPSATTAYSFVYQMQYDDTDGPMPAQLTGREFRRFRHDYCRWLRNHGVSLGVAVAASFRH